MKALFALMHVLTLGRLRASRPVEGNAATMGLGDKLWWGYKFYGHPITQPEPGKGIREHFARTGLKAAGFLAAEPAAAKKAGSAVVEEDAVPAPATCYAPTAAVAPAPAPCNAATAAAAAAPAAPAPTSDRVTLAFAGDILPSPNLQDGNAAHLFDDIADFYLGADMRCANLEAPIVTALEPCWPGENIVAVPRLNTSEAAFDAVYQDGRGVNIFSTANNHALDQGASGLLETLDFLDKKGALHVGTARSQKERDEFPVTGPDKRQPDKCPPSSGQSASEPGLLPGASSGEIRVAWLSWTFSLNREQLPPGREFLANHLRLNAPDVDIEPLVEQIRRARQERHADVVVACLHWGLEYESFPLARQIELGQRIIESGVDIIAGNHPHGLQPVECHRYRDAEGRQRTGLIIYGLGDMISDTPQVKFSALTAVVRVEFAHAADGSVALANAEARPLYAYRRYDSQGRCVDLRLLDFRRLLNRLADEDAGAGGTDAGAGAGGTDASAGAGVNEPDGAAQPPLDAEQRREVAILKPLLETLMY
ncbi:MAG: CapA family protein [Coriobacteriales bacterium]|jgi:poly-gamma-glutamate synthesis protein (capsule biosynthesis protein)|nr:CapA family protein [Coriobacteriales bacterium]